MLPNRLRCLLVLLAALIPLTLGLLSTGASANTLSGAALVKDINPGPDSSANSAYDGGGFGGQVALNGVAYFFANDGSHGAELWRSDGTSAGTFMVKDINPGPNGGLPDLGFGDGSYDQAYLAVAGSTLYFFADDGVHGMELWKSDGTEAGTMLVKDINPGPNGSDSDGPGSVSYTYNLLAVGSILYFTADDGTHGHELWRSDGTEAGTVMVKEITPGGDTTPSGDPCCAPPSELTAVGSTLYFVDGTNGDLWKTAGTDAGTVLVKAGLNVQYLTAVGSTLYFSGDDGTSSGLWKSDGTEAGTVLVSDTNPSMDTDSQRFAVIGSTLYFSAGDSLHGGELWRSDGTTVGTFLVKDINPGPNGSGPGGDGYELTPVGSTLYFRADDGLHGYELWKSDGTEAGTELVKDINANPAPGLPPGFPNTDDSLPYAFTAVGSEVYFTADDGFGASDHGLELWRSDGTEAGTVMADINPGAGSSLPGGLDRIAAGFVAVGSTLLFSADDGVHGRELWRVSAANSGTPPANTAPPAVTGSPSVGLTLSASTGSWSGDMPINYAYQWLRDGAPIAGATSQSYVVTAADQGHALAVQVTATNSSGSASATSAALSVPAAPPPPPVSVVSLGKVGVKPGAVVLQVHCSNGRGCGRVTAQLTVVEHLRRGKITAITARKRHPTTRTVVIGKATTTLAAGQTTRLVVRLNHTGRALLKRYKHLKARLRLMSGRKVALERAVRLRLAGRRR